jgi:cyclopropane fatty-acyl-phospholipid synthase-like methyltransferase
MLIHDYVLSAVTCITGERVNNLSSYYDFTYGNDNSSISRLKYLEKSVMELGDDTAYIIACSRLIISRAQVELYARIRHGKLRFNIVLICICMYVLVEMMIYKYAWQSMVVNNGFLGGAVGGNGRYNGVDGYESVSSTNAPPSVYLLSSSSELPCSTEITDSSSTDKSLYHYTAYKKTCLYYESVLWNYYVDSSFYNTCDVEDNGGDGNHYYFSSLFTREKASGSGPGSGPGSLSDTPTKKCQTPSPSSKESALNNGMNVYWSSNIIVNPGLTYPDYPLIVHSSGEYVGDRHMFDKGINSDKDGSVLFRRIVDENTRNGYSVCTVDPALINPSLISGDYSRHKNFTYLYKNANDGTNTPETNTPETNTRDANTPECPTNDSDNIKEYYSARSKEYDRLGSDSINVLVRSEVMRMYNKAADRIQNCVECSREEKEDMMKKEFTILDAGSGLGGTMYSLAAKLPLNQYNQYNNHEDNNNNDNNNNNNNNNNNTLNVAYRGITLSSAEATMSRAEAKKRDLLPPKVTFEQHSYDDDTTLKDSNFSVIIALESLSHSINLKRTLNTLSDSLDVGGKIIIVDYVKEGIRNSHVPTAVHSGSSESVSESSSWWGGNNNSNNNRKQRTDTRGNAGITPRYPNQNPNYHQGPTGYADRWEAGKCGRKAEVEGIRSSLLPIGYWLDAFGDAGLQVEEIEDLTLHYDFVAKGKKTTFEGKHQRLRRMGREVSAKWVWEDYYKFFWTWWVFGQDVLLNVFGMDYSIDAKEVELGGLAAEARTFFLGREREEDILADDGEAAAVAESSDGTSTKSLREQRKILSTWNTFVQGAKFATTRVNQLFRAKKHVHRSSSYELCALDGGEMSMYYMVVSKKRAKL